MKLVKNGLQSVKNVVLVSLVILGFTSAANAALPTAVTDPTTGAFAVLTADFNALLDFIWPLVVVVTVAFIILRMFKRGASVATS